MTVELQRSDLYEVSQWSNTSSHVIGTEPNYTIVRFIPMATGRFLDDADLTNRRRVAVLGFKAAALLFAGRPMLGQTITINGTAFTVVGGVGKISRGNNDFDDQKVYVPVTTMLELFPLKGDNIPCAMAELVLLPAPAPTGLVTSDLLVLLLDDGHQGVGVRGTRALHLGLGRLGPARRPTVAAPGRRVQDGGLLGHVGPLLGQEGRGQGARLGHGVLGCGVHGLVQVGFGRCRLHCLDVQDVTQVVAVDDLHELSEHGVPLLLPGVEGIGLDRPAQVDAVLEVVHLGEMVAPARVHDLQVDVALDLAHGLRATGHGLRMRLVVVEHLLDDRLHQVLGGGRLFEVDRA